MLSITALLVDQSKTLNSQSLVATTTCSTWKQSRTCCASFNYEPWLLITPFIPLSPGSYHIQLQDDRLPLSDLIILSVLHKRVVVSRLPTALSGLSIVSYIAISELRFHIFPGARCDISPRILTLCTYDF